jgi:hypothetical protein
VIYWGTCEELRTDGTDELMLVAKR